MNSNTKIVAALVVVFAALILFILGFHNYTSTKGQNLDPSPINSSTRSYSNNEYQIEDNNDNSMGASDHLGKGLEHFGF
jgi:hypothetical protein